MNLSNKTKNADIIYFSGLRLDAFSRQNNQKRNQQNTNTKENKYKSITNSTKYI